MSGKEESQNVKVAVRCRPLNEREKAVRANICLEMNGNVTAITNPKSANGEKKSFTYDHSYWMDESQETVYNDLGLPMLKKAIEGFNATIFAYGQTGSGKSYSMTGYGDAIGITPRMNNDIFKKLNEKSEAEGKGYRYIVTVSYLEIYKEVIKDLLSGSEEPLRIREHPKLGIYVEGLAEFSVKTVNEIDRLKTQGDKIRQVGATNMNATSSRSHSVFTIKIEQKTERMEGNNLKSTTLNSKINLVDLAGSERAERTGARGDQLKEGAMINLSLSVLGNVINAIADLSDPKKKGQHFIVPYRDSTLTRILQESLGGNTMTVMLCAISGASDSYDETLSTLNYANRAKAIQNKAVKNEDATQRVIRELREEVERLRALLSSSATQNSGNKKATGGGKENGEIDSSQMRDMEETIAALEHAKNQTFEEKENMSKLYEEERKRNLAARGMLEMMMEELKEENQKLKERMQALQDEKNKATDDFNIQKNSIESMKEKLKQEIHEYQAIVMKGEQDTTEGRSKAESIQNLRKELKIATENLKGLKLKLKEISNEQRREKEDFRANSNVIGENSQLRKAIQDDEKKKMAEENEKFLNEEKQKMTDELEAEKRKIRQEAELKFQMGSQASLKHLSSGNETKKKKETKKKNDDDDEVEFDLIDHNNNSNNNNNNNNDNSKEDDEDEDDKDENEDEDDGNGVVSLEEYVSLELKVANLESDKRLLELKLQQMQAENSKFKERLAIELEKQQAEYFQIFQRYRETLESNQKITEQKYIQLLEEACYDAIYANSTLAKHKKQHHRQLL